MVNLVIEARARSLVPLPCPRCGMPVHLAWNAEGSWLVEVPPGAADAAADAAAPLTVRGHRCPADAFPEGHFTLRVLTGKEEYRG